MSRHRTLLAILACAPKTSGTRTRNRVQHISELLGYQSFTICNLVNVATTNLAELTELACNPADWLDQRVKLREAVEHSSGVLLAFGKAGPSGEAGAHWREQVSWLRDFLSSQDLVIHQFGSHTHHPSRWQRITAKKYPELEFRVAQQLELQTYASNVLRSK